MTNAEHIKTGLLHLEVAIDHLEKGLALSTTPGNTRQHPRPETRVLIRELRTTLSSLRYEWRDLWRHKT